MKIGLIREEKISTDNRVAFTPEQCKWIKHYYPLINIVVQPSVNRCFSDEEYKKAGIILQEDLVACDLLMGIKEVPVERLIPEKTYMIFSHTKKQQSYNQRLLRSILYKNISLIDYECLEHEDGQRILGFGFFAGVVGAHNGLMAYGRKTVTFKLMPVNKSRNFNSLLHKYFGLKLPNMKIAVTGSGRVTKGIIEIMNLLDIKEVEPEDFLEKKYAYAVYTQLKGGLLYGRNTDDGYNRDEFHKKSSLYHCKFRPYIKETDLLINGIYWEEGMPPLFLTEDICKPDFNIKVIADITCDKYGSIPCNLGASTIADPVYGVDKFALTKTAPYQPKTIDMMAVDNLPNELPRDASKYFGEQLIKYVLEPLLKENDPMIARATIVKDGELTPPYQYLKAYAYGDPLLAIKDTDSNL